ncbi:hypothetical protein ACFXGA_07875 [Actinosynnema sp. NPDC059335]|uniref:hypothetical protein n=1 Tax=Actinosynnema sp. NPDC059335 TaxID=3346804 RepID=UPI00366C199D
MVEDGSARLANAGGRRGEEFGESWWDIGIDKVGAVTRALAAANDAGALSIDPEAVDSITKKLSAIRVQLLDDMTMFSTYLTSGNSLGGGYAEKIGEVNRKIAAHVLATLIPKLAQAIEDLAEEIKKSGAYYLRTDDTQKSVFGHIEGQVQ